MLKIYHIFASELYDKLSAENYPTYIKDNGMVSYKDMHYFSPKAISTYNYFDFAIDGEDLSTIVVVAEINNIIVGVIKMLRKDILENTKVPFFTDKSNASYKIVEFIDVNKEYRQQGIAKSLYKYVNDNLIVDGEYLVGTGMSKDGAKANVHKLRKDIVTKAKFFSDVYEFSDFFNNSIVGNY